MPAENTITPAALPGCSPPFSLERSSCLGTMLCNLLTRSELAGIPNLTTARRHTMPITSYEGRHCFLGHVTALPVPRPPEQEEVIPFPTKSILPSLGTTQKHRSVAYISQTPGSSYPSSPAQHPVGAQQGYPPDECGREVVCNETAGRACRVSTCIGTEGPPPYRHTDQGHPGLSLKACTAGRKLTL